MSIVIPWHDLLNESTVVEIKNLEVTLQPRQRDDAAGMKVIIYCNSHGTK